VRGIDVAIAPGLNVGYVMGRRRHSRGDRTAGAKVQLLDAEDLTTGNLRQFSTIVTGTRAYAVRRS
jgi:hypothetical protein